MDKINILYVIWSLDLGGAERVVVDLAKQSDRDQFNPIVCCLNEKGKFAPELEILGITVVSLSKRPKFDPAIILKLIRVMDKFNIDVVNTHLWTSNFWGRIAAFLAGVKVIVATEHTTDEHRPWYYHLADNLLAHITTKIIAVSTSVKNFHRERSNISSKKFTVINNGIDINAFDITIDWEKRRQDLGLNPDDFVIGLFGRFVPAKAHEILLHAVADIIGLHPKIKILFAGSGPTENKIKNITHKLNLDEVVIFAGFRTDIPELYKIIDLFVLCSRREGFPITLLEAMASGVPSIVTDVGGNSDIIIDGKNGFLIEPYNIELLAQKINYLIEHPNIALKMSRNAYRFVRNKFTSRKMTLNTESLMERELRGKITSNRKINLLFIIDNLNPGGSPRQLIQLATRLPREIFSITVCSLDKENNSLKDLLIVEDIPFYSIAQHGFFDAKALLKLLVFIKKGKYDIVNTYLFTADTYGRICAKLCRTPVILASIRSVDNWKSFHHKLVDKTLSMFTDKIIVNAKAIISFLHDEEGINKQKIEVIYNGIDKDIFSFTPSQLMVKTKLGLSDKDFLIGIFARNDPVKDHVNFFKAAQLTLRKMSNVYFLAMGYGVNNEQMKNIVMKLGIEKNVILKDHSPDYLSLLCDVDISVINSLTEGCSNVILESMALKKPVVATAVGGNPELVINNQTGILIPKKSPQKLSEAMISLLSDKNLMQNMGNKAYEIAKSRFSMARMISQTKGLYIQQLKNKKYFDKIY